MSDEPDLQEELIAASISLFEGDRDAAIRWLQTPNQGLDGQTPLNYAVTEEGKKEVLFLIQRLEQGIF